MYDVRMNVLVIVTLYVAVVFDIAATKTTSAESRRMNDRRKSRYVNDAEADRPRQSYIS